MKRLILSILVSFIAIVLPAQAPVTLQGSDRDAAISKIQKASSLEKPLSFDFKMTKHNTLMAQDLVSTGSAAMIFPDKVLWKVDAPHASQFIMNGNLMRTGTGSKAKTTDISANRRFQSIARNLSNVKSRGLINDTDFKVTVYSCNGSYQVDMVPQRRDLGQIFSMITLMADAKTGAISSIILSETSGDSSVIKIMNTSHEAISETTFKVN